ncbi:hypothetical protein BGX29_003656, partial [Mortierella sp. GBA35]
MDTTTITNGSQQKTDIPYEIFERASEIKNLGAAFVISHNLTSILKQCGIYDEYLTISSMMPGVNIVNEDCETEFSMQIPKGPFDRDEDSRSVSRPQFYDLLLRQLPKERIHLGKKVQSTQEGEGGVLIRCTEGSEYEGDILVGADGAYSAVRQNMYAQLKKDNKLPHSDSLPLPFLTVCLVGQTRPLDSSEFPDVAKPDSQVQNMMGKDKPYA